MMAESSATKSRMEVRIAPTTYDDLHGIATCELLAFSGAFPPYELVSRLIRPFRAPLARSGAHPRHWPDFASIVRERGRNLLEGSIMFTAFGKDEKGTEVVVGSARMTPPKAMLEKTRENRKWKDRVLSDVVYPVVENVRKKLWRDSDGTNTRFLSIFRKELEAARDRVDKERRCFLLNMLYAHPSFQGKGVGSALLEQCCSVADAEGLPLILESTVAGVPLYTSRDFAQVDVVDFTYAGERITLPCMIREPVAPPPPPKNGNFVIDTHGSTPDPDIQDRQGGQDDTIHKELDA